MPPPPPPPPPNEQHPDELAEGDGKGFDGHDDPPTPGNDEGFGEDDEDKKNKKKEDETEQDEEKDPRGLALTVADPPAASKVESKTGPSSIPIDGLVVAAANANASTTSVVAGLSREELEQRLLSVEGDLRVATDRIQTLISINNRDQPSQSLPSQLVLAFLAALGFAPPLLVNVDAVLKWKGWKALRCRNRSGDDDGDGCNASEGSDPSSPPQRETLRRADEDDDDGGSVSGAEGDSDERKSLVKRTIHRIRTNLRLPFYAVVSLVDFADAILDLILSARALLEDSDDDDLGVKGWALLLFAATILARLLGGVFGVVYHRIDQKDREVSYFLVEMTIWWMEDNAAVAYLFMKLSRDGVLTPLERFSFLFTAVCSLVFVIPTLCRYKNIGKRLRPCAAWILFGWCLFILVAVPAFIILSLIPRTLGRMMAVFLPNIESMYRVLYPIFNAIQLYLLFEWSRYLYQKAGSRAATARLSDRSVPAGGDDLAPR